MEEKMIIEKIPVNKRLKTFQNMLQEVYGNDPQFKNNKEGIYSLVCNPKMQFYQKSQQEMVVVKVDNKIQCLSVLILHEARPDVLCMAFFEAYEKSENAVKKMIDYATDFGRKRSCELLIIGLEGHCNYGLGFLDKAKDNKNSGYPTFGEAYSPKYYTELFEALGSDLVPHRYHSFFDQVQHIEKRVESYMQRFSKVRDDFTIDKSSFIGKGFTSTMRRYTDLNNLIFHGHISYYHREYGEDVELFRSMAPLLNPDNLLFIQYKGKDIGFILWYPDFNELVSPNKGASILTFIRYRLLKQRPKSLKIVEIGVDPKFRATPAILFLFHGVVEASKCQTSFLFRKHKYDRLISSWIDTNNLPSTRVTQKFAQQAHKEYVTYEKRIEKHSV